MLNTYDLCNGVRVNGTLCRSQSTDVVPDGNHGTIRKYVFDSFGRGVGQSVALGANAVTESGATFSLPDSNGRTSMIVYPSALSVRYTYSPTTGYLQQIADAGDGTVYWRANARNLDGQISSMSVGPLSVTKTYDGLGRAKTISAANGAASLQAATYGFDAIGNLLSRSDSANPIAGQSFTYDALNRLATIDGATISYDDAGNITARDGITYNYPGGSNRVGSTSGSYTASYTYDAVGNVKTSANRTVTWKPFNKPASITKGSQSLSWAYEGDQGRVREISTATGTTTYYPGMDRMKALDNSVRLRHYISTPEGTVAAVDLVQATGARERKYWLTDHLGSVVATFDGTTGQKTSHGFDAWGKRASTVAVNSTYTQRGFTGHEMLDEVDLVHMNGRVYDPFIGKFLSADPIVQAPFNGQSFNRYSYVMNNPLSATDPTGYSSWWVQWRRPIAAIAVAVVTGQWAAAYGNAAVTTILEGGTPFMIGGSVANTTAAIVMAGGFAAGGIAGGNIESALQGAFFAGMNFGIGEFLTGADNIGAHAIVGCAQQMAAGGSCRGGAMSGGFSSFAGQAGVINDAGVLGRVAAGAIASRLAGDSAQNGAVTAAFDAMFNCWLHMGCWSRTAQFAQSAWSRVQVAAGSFLQSPAGQFLFGWAQSEIGNPSYSGAKTVVLGHFDSALHSPNYVEVAKSAGAHVFNIPPSLWKEMDPVVRQQWNLRFLDWAVERGMDFRLSGRVIDLNSSYATELAHMATVHGLVPNSNFTQLVRRSELIPR